MFCATIQTVQLCSNWCGLELVFGSRVPMVNTHGLYWPGWFCQTPNDSRGCPHPVLFRRTPNQPHNASYIDAWTHFPSWHQVAPRFSLGAPPYFSQNFNYFFRCEKTNVPILESRNSPGIVGHGRERLFGEFAMETNSNSIPILSFKWNRNKFKQPTCRRSVVSCSRNARARRSLWEPPRQVHG